MGRETELGSDLLIACAKGLVALLVPGGGAAIALNELAAPLARIGWLWFKGRGHDEQRHALDQLANMSMETASAIAASQFDPAAIGQNAVRTCTHYLTTVPMTARQTVSCLETGKAATRLSQLPRSAEDFARFLPTREPLFSPGDPVPGRDYMLDCLLGQGAFGEVWRA